NEEIRASCPEAEFTDARGGLLTPGLINLHSHLYSAFALGMPWNLPAPRDFDQILERLWWRVDQALDLDGVYHSGVSGLLDAARVGITTLVDHHASPSFIHGSLDRIAQSYDDVGLRGLLCYEITDRNGLEGARAGLAENIRFLRKSEKKENLRGMVGIHASFTIGEETLDAIAEAMQGLDGGIHVHAAEAASDVETSRKRFGKHPVERYASRGLLSPKTLMAHGVHLNETTLKAMVEAGVTLAHNPNSNLNNAVGVAPIVHYLKEGLLVGIGTDGLGQDILTETKSAFYLGKNRSHDPSAWFTGDLVELWKNSARFVSRYFERKVGILEKDAFADLVLWNYDPPCAIEERNWDGHLFFGLHPRLVDSVWTAGKPILRKGEFTCDSERLMREARVEAKKTWERLERI
ncbi:MAG TPA: amidohydrolase family protein, partial [Chroococcales cyanobacterium]